MLVQSDWLVKHEFVTLLAALPARATIVRLDALLSDPNWHNRDIAVSVTAARNDPKRRRLLQQALLDEHPRVTRHNLEHKQGDLT